MSPVAVRWLAASMCVLAFAVRLVEVVWFRPLSWRVEPAALGLAVGLTGFVASTAVPLALYAWAVWRWRRPATLGVDASKGRFVVPTEPFWRGTQGIVAAGFGGAAAIPVERVPDGDAVRLARYPEVFTISIAAAVLLLVVTALLLVNLPSLALDPAGLTVRWLARRQRIRWEHLLPGGPPPPAERGLSSQLTLYLAPAAPYAAPFRVNVPVGRLGVSPEFLAAAIRHYVEEPQRRPGIGTGGELTRLRAALAAPPPAPSVG